MNGNIPPEVFKALDKFILSKKCSVPASFSKDCSNRIIKAHTVSKSSSLKEIAENSHVYGITPDLRKLDEHEGKFVPEPIGINQASTFTGFCSIHDKELFSKIEDKPFLSIPEQCFLIAYRSLARELYIKDGMNKFVEKINDKKIPTINEIILQKAFQQSGYINELTLADLTFIKCRFDELLTNQIYNELHHDILILTEPPQLMASATLALQFDFQGNTIQTLNNNPECPDYTIINSFSSDGIGYFILSSLNTQRKTTKLFIESLLQLNKREIGNALVRFIVSYCENFYIGPKWWNSKSKVIQDSMIDRFLHGIDGGNYSTNALVDDGIIFDAINYKEYSQI